MRNEGDGSNRILADVLLPAAAVSKQLRTGNVPLI